MAILFSFFFSILNFFPKMSFFQVELSPVIPLFKFMNLYVVSFFSFEVQTHDLQV